MAEAVAERAQKESIEGISDRRGDLEIPAETLRRGGSAEKSKSERSLRRRGLASGFETLRNTNTGGSLLLLEKFGEEFG